MCTRLAPSIEMEMTLGKRPRVQGVSVDDVALLRAIESVNPHCGSGDMAARRWELVAERVAAATGDDASVEVCRKRYEELLNGDTTELSDDVKAVLDSHKQWLQSERLCGVSGGQEPSERSQETTSGDDVDGVERPGKQAIPTKRGGGGGSPVIKTEPGVSMVSPPASGKKRKTSVSPASVVARERRNSLLARVTARLDRQEKRATTKDDAMESLAARVARNPQAVSVLAPVAARAAPVSVVSPAKSLQQLRLETPKRSDVFFSPAKAARPKEETKTPLGKVVRGEETQEDGRELTPRKVVRAGTTPVKAGRRSSAKKVLQALADEMTAVATTPPRSKEGECVETEPREDKAAAATPGVPAEAVSTRAPVSEAPCADEAESTAIDDGSHTIETQEASSIEEEAERGQEEATQDSHTRSEVDSVSDTMDIEMQAADPDGGAEEGASPSPSIDFVDEGEEQLDKPHSGAKATRMEPLESFASREDVDELKQTVAMLVSSLTESRADQAALKSDLEGTQQCLRICEGMCVVLQQQVGTLTTSLSDAQVRNAKLHEEVVLLREELQQGRAMRLKELAEIPSTKPAEATATVAETTTAEAPSALPSELQDIREAIRVHMETVTAAQETRKAAVAAGFGVIDSQLQQLQAAVSRGEQRYEELAATVDSVRSSFESQLTAHERSYKTMLEGEQQSREEVLATVERERDELERERRKQFQQYQATVDEEQRKRELMLATFNEKSQRELERLRDVADVNLRVRNELLFKVKAEREQAKTQSLDRVQALEGKMATLNESLIGVQVGLREHREHARASTTSQQQALETLKHHVEQLQAILDNKPSGEYMKAGDSPHDVYGLSRRVERLSASLAQVQDSLTKQKQANKLRAMEHDSKTKIEWSELRRTLETERSERMRDFSKLLTIVRQSQTGGGNESE